MEANMNVVVDELAKQYQDKLGSYRSTTHMYPSVPAVLEINSMAITSNIRHQFIKAYIEQICMKCMWIGEIIQSIAWKCLNLKLKRTVREALLMKICNDLLQAAATL